MQMPAGPIVAASAAPLPGLIGSQQGAASPDGGSQSFTQMLVQVVGVAPSGVQQASTSSNALSALMMQGDLAVKGEEQTGLLKLLSDIASELEQMEQSDDQTVDTAPLEELLGDLQVLLFSMMLAQPATLAMQQSTVQGNGVEETSEGAQAVAGFAGVKAKLLEVIQQLGTIMRQGASNQAQQAFVPLLENKLDTLKQWLHTNAGKATSDSQEQQLDLKGGTLQTANQPTSQSMLARLGQASYHPSIRHAAEAGSASAALQDHTTAQTASGEAQTNTVVHLSASTEPLRPQLPAQAPTLPSVPVDQFAEKMEGFLFKQMQLSSLKGASEARISLYPEHLGQVDIKLTLHNGQLTALFTTDNKLAKDMLENQMAQLRSALQAQGLQVERLEVSQTPQPGQHQFQDGRQQQGSGQQHPSEQHAQAEQVTEESFETEFRRLAEQLNDGTGINVTA